MGYQQCTGIPEWGISSVVGSQSGNTILLFMNSENVTGFFNIKFTSPVFYINMYISISRSKPHYVRPALRNNKSKFAYTIVYVVQVIQG